MQTCRRSPSSCPQRRIRARSAPRAILDSPDTVIQWRSGMFRSRSFKSSGGLNVLQLGLGGGRTLRGQEGLAKSFCEIKATFEIIAAVLIGFRQQRIFDHVEDDFAD